MHGRGVCMAGGACMAGGCAWWGGMYGRGHAWWGACMARGACVVGAGMAGGACMPQQILRDTVNERAVRILLECIRVSRQFPFFSNQQRFLFRRNMNLSLIN